ncbi:hypothetical protein [uncultured Draconibacterium sp.]|uniref:hypothetical protein n=1 Tax=uncultured Draconibacterium sp. TaxID=1573823 RepID=UPI0032171A0D
MKSSALILLIFLFTGMSSFISQAQEAPVMPTTYYVIEEFVQPADNQTFIKVQQEAVDYWKKFEFDVPIFTYATNSGSYYWVLPIENFAGIDQLFKKAGELTGKMKEAGYDANEKFKDLSTARQMVIHWSKDLSYHPDGMMGQTANNTYCEWTFMYLKPGHEKEATEAAQKYKAFYDSVEETSDWDVYTVWMGYDTPCWILMSRAESEMAMLEQETKLQAKYSEKFQELWNNFSVHVRKIENQKGWFLPNWSLNFEQ